jgi:hypothetical protein
MTDPRLRIAQQLTEAGRVFADYQDYGYALARLNAIGRASDELTDCIIMHAQIGDRQDSALTEAEGHIADLEHEISVLRMRIAELEHGRIESQAAHNRLALAVEALEGRVATLAGRFYAGNGGYA